jgi:transposase-like protein
MEERDAYSVAEFCRRHGFSKGFLYAEWRKGRGPRFLLAGDRRLITRESAADWRREREVSSEATAPQHAA